MTVCPVMMAAALLLPAVEGLGHRDFRHRERCQRAVAGAGVLAWPVLRTEGDAEVVNRCRLVRSALVGAEEARLVAAVEALRPKAGWPWLALGGSWQGPENARYVSRATEYIEGIGPEWANWKEACRLWVAERVRAGAFIDALRAELASFAALEAKWHGSRDR